MTEIKGEIKEPMSERGSSVSEREIKERKKQIIDFLKKKTSWIFYSILFVILSISVYIRTRPMMINSATGKPKLWDITTNTWTLGPDLDPFLFLRWAKYIAEHGKLFLLDVMRSVPLADICSGATCNPINTAGDMKLLSYLIAGLYKFISAFNKELTVTYAAIILPVIMAVLTGIAFFLFTRKLFYKESKKTANIIALISTAFFVLVPSLLSRSIAGIPEKESVAFFFIFMIFYFILEAFTSEKLKRGLIFGGLAGIFTGLLELIWGGGAIVFVIIAGAVLFEFLLGKIDRNKFYSFLAWVVGFVIIMVPFSTRYSFSELVTSTSTALVFILLFILAVDFLIFNKKIFHINDRLKRIKIPRQLISIIMGVILLIILAISIFGLSFVTHIIKDVISNTVHPLTQNRFTVTVAENQQPYFLGNWAGEFGPIVFNLQYLPLFFWLFFAGSVLLFSHLIKPLEKKEKRILTFSYIIFLAGLVFSKYSSGSSLNGESLTSYIVYFGGVLFFAGTLIYVYFKRYKEGKFSSFSELNFPYILYLIAFTIAIIAARGGVRLIMILGAVSPVVVGFLIVKTIKDYFKEKEEMRKLFVGIFALIILIASIFTLWTYYQSDKSMAENYAPGVYQFQWQNAMSWVRDNTPANAVFAHWWDYGYWVQSIGERSTILDGGNAVGYWNHLMGRNVLTATNEQDTLDFLYSHNGTHLLIDSTDIGKYSAFSSIGSDEDYDRYSWIPTVMMDPAQTAESNNETVYIYPVGTYLDQDFVLNENGKEVLFPKRGAVVAAVGLKTGSKGEILQPIIFIAYHGKQYQMPLRYVYAIGKLYDFKSGFDAGLYTFPLISKNSEGKLNVNKMGTAFYLSERTIHSELARLYLFEEKSDHFKLVHEEQTIINNDFKRQGLDLGGFVYDNVYGSGFQGPIKIWQINYPSGMKVNPEYLSIDYPEEFKIVKPGEY